MRSTAFDLTGRVAVVTGAAGLIGRAHCAALAQAGATVVACDLDLVSAAGVANELGTQHIGIGVDIADERDVQQLQAHVLAKYGRVDVLVNNAAMNDMVEQRSLMAEASMFEHYPLDLWRRVMEVNVTGTMLCCRILGGFMAQRGSGSIINIASTYGIVAPNQSIYQDETGTQRFYKSAAYPVSKAAVIMLTKYLATYWGKSGVRVNTLSPGGVENHQDPFFIGQYSHHTPMGRMASVHDYEGALVFLASDASAYMTGHNLVVDGGWTAW